MSDLDLVALTGARPETWVLTAIHEELDAGVAAGSNLGCVNVTADQLDDHDPAHPTWTHGHGAPSAVRNPPGRAGAARPDGLQRPVHPAFPAVAKDDVRDAARREIGDYWARAVKHPHWWLVEPVIAELSLTAMTRARHAVRHGRLLTKTAAIEEVGFRSGCVHGSGSVRLGRLGTTPVERWSP